MDAGYLTAPRPDRRGRRARAHARDGKLHFVAIAGDRTTPSSIHRNNGMQRAGAEASDVVVDQVVYGAGRATRARSRPSGCSRAIPRRGSSGPATTSWPSARCGAGEARGKARASDAWFRGVNTSAEALEAVRSGRLAALAGGHFICGAWAIVLIHDYCARPRLRREGLEFNRTMFTLFDRGQAGRFIERYSENFSAIDFRRYSKAANPKLARYDFDFGQFLR
jgi:hypothetical protein